MSLTNVLLLIGTCYFVSLNARLSRSNSKPAADVGDVDVPRSTTFDHPPRRLQYSQDESRYMVWDFSERVNADKFPGVRKDEMFGSAVTIWDQYMVVGASGDRSREFASGAAYIYSKQNYGDGTYYWDFLEVLEPWDGHDGDNFGIAVDLHLYTLVVGANMNDENGQDAGAAYIYECYNNAPHHHDEHHHEEQEDMQRMWYLVAKLMPKEGLPQDYFGSSVATQGNLTVVGAYGSDVMGTFAGSVYVWRKTWHLDDPHHPWEWVYDEMVVASDGERYDFFGISLAIDGIKLAIGAPGVDVDEMYKAGAVYVFQYTYDDNVEDGFSYQLLSKLTTGESGNTFENFGQSVSLWDYNLVVGAPNSDVDDIHAAGAFYSYGFDSYGIPYLIEKVSPEYPSPEAHCGYSIDVFNDLAVMGCPNASGFGSIYIYTEVSPLTTPLTKNFHWLFESRKRVSDGWSVGDMFGYTVSVYDDTVSVGAYKALSDVGATYLYIGRRKIYQDLFESNETDDTAMPEADQDDDFKEMIEEIVLQFEEKNPNVTKAGVFILFLLVLWAVTSFNKKREESVRESSSTYRKKHEYELTTMDSSHDSGDVMNTSRTSSMGIPPASSRHSGAAYTPITTSETKGSSQRVRDLVAAGLISKPSQKNTPLQPTVSPVFSPLASSSSYKPGKSTTASPPEPGQ